MTGKLETREHTPPAEHAARTGLSVSLAIMATMPVTPSADPYTEKDCRALAPPVQRAR